MFKIIISAFLTLITITNSQILGSQRDNHGCSIDGGYKWCESSQSCIRPWMTECPLIKDNCHKDSYGNCVDDNCRSWYDGCNTCMVSENGMLGCTRMFCQNPRKAFCRSYTSLKKNTLQENDICYRFCEDGSQVTINKKDDCPSGTSCLSSTQSMISFDSCGTRAHRCLQNNH